MQSLDLWSAFEDRFDDDSMNILILKQRKVSYMHLGQYC